MTSRKGSSSATACWSSTSPAGTRPTPTAYGATITYDFDARNGGIPFQTIKEETHVLQARMTAAGHTIRAIVPAATSATTTPT